MRILYLNPDRGVPVLGDKGASVHVRQFAAALAGSGHEVLLLAARLGEGNSPPPVRLVEAPPRTDSNLLAAAATAVGVSASPDKVMRNELIRIAYDRELTARATAALASEGFQPDLIYERHALFHSAGGTLARALGTTRIVEVNAPLVREQETFRGLVLKQEAIRAEAANLTTADLVVAVSNEVAAHVAACGVDRRRILVVPNGVDTSLFHPGAGGKGVREKYGLGQRPVLGFVGSFKPWHGVAFLIDAFAAIARHRPDARLLAIGDGPELEAARMQISSLNLTDHCILTGRAPHAEVPAHLAAMDISAAPYDLAGEFYFSPMKVVESLSSGVPVVAVRAGQLVSMVEHGRTGLLFPAGDQRAFVNAVLSLFADPTLVRTMAAAGRQRAVEAFSWSAVASRILDVADHLARERRAA